MQDEANEVFAILCLTTKYRVIAYHEVSRGTINATLVEPRGVFTAALLAHAAAIIAVLVHPSGDPTQSPDDFDVTHRLAAAGRLLGIELLDHIILGDRRYWSLKEIGRL
jgi:DNA repair protein RadC